MKSFEGREVYHYRSILFPSFLLACLDMLKILKISKIRLYMVCRKIWVIPCFFFANKLGFLKEQAFCYSLRFSTYWSSTYQGSTVVASTASRSNIPQQADLFSPELRSRQIKSSNVLLRNSPLTDASNVVDVDKPVAYDLLSKLHSFDSSSMNAKRLGHLTGQEGQCCLLQVRIRSPADNS